MKLEARWDNAGRDQLTIGEMVEMGKDGYKLIRTDTIWPPLITNS